MGMVVVCGKCGFESGKHAPWCMKALLELDRAPSYPIEIVINDPRAGDWVREKIPKVAQWTEGFKSLAAVEGDEIVGAVVYDAFTPYDCCIHVRLDKPGCKDTWVLRQVFGYPFEQLGLKRITGLVGKSNAKGQELCTWLGFCFEGVKKLGLGDEDEVIYGMTREDCQWL